MAKLFVICIDGTGCSPGQIDKKKNADRYSDKYAENEYLAVEEVATESNVLKTWKAVTGKSSVQGAERLVGINAPELESGYHAGFKLGDAYGHALYLCGIGSKGTVSRRLFDRATGTGMSERILDAYRFLCERWEPGDRIYLFGFSRGAFAVRSLAGLIEHAGIKAGCNILAAYKNYYDGNGKIQGDVPPINFLGIWDTVGALPLRENVNAFHKISPGNVEYVSHALALDEIRSAFTPDFWDNESVFAEQMWFSGAHTNIGGGYLNADLSNITLFWMLVNAERTGLSLNLREIYGWELERVRCPSRDSYREFIETELPLIGKLIAKYKLGTKERRLLPGHMIHRSVEDRMRELPEYKPRQLAAHRYDFQINFTDWNC